MIKKILSFGIIEGAAKALNVLMMLVLPFVASVDLYAEINVLIAVQVIMVSIILFGMDRAILRFLKEFNHSIFWASYFTLWLKIVFIIFPVFVLAYLYWYRDTDSMLTILILSGLIFLQALRQINIAKHRANHYIKGFLIFRLLIQFFIFIFIIISVTFFKTINAFLIAYCFAIIPFVFRKIKPQKNLLKGRCKKIQRKLFAFSWPLVFHTIGSALMMSIDRLMLNNFLEKQDVAIYSFGYTFGAAITFIYAVCNAYFEPKIITISQKNKDLRENALSSYTSVQLVLAAIAGILILWLSPYIISYFYNDLYLKSLPIIAVILLTHFFNPIYLQSNFRLMNIKKTGFIALSSFISGGINIVLNFIFLKRGMGIMGAAYATFISYLLLAIVIYFFSIRKAKVTLLTKDKVFLICNITIITLGLLNLDSQLILTGLIFCLVILHIFNAKLILKPYKN